MYLADTLKSLHTGFPSCQPNNSKEALEVIQRQNITAKKQFIIIIIIIIIRNLYSAIMPLGGYRGAGGTRR